MLALKGWQAGDLFFGVNLGKGVYVVAELTPVVGSPPCTLPFGHSHRHTVTQSFCITHACLSLSV